MVSIPNPSPAVGPADTVAQRPFLSVTEFGALIGVKRSRAQVLVASGAVPHVRLGRRIFIPRRGVEALIDGAIARAGGER